MVAKIKSGKSLAGAFNYNERKVKAGKAKLIGAALYGKDHRLLSINDKLFRLKDLAARNSRTKTNTVHISLNFDVTENLSQDMLMNIADSYMEKIGFGSQPYLVYQHHDAGHPHIHLVATNIRSDGTRISLHNIGRLKSEPARKAVEIEFGLVKADLKTTQEQVFKDLKPIVYGNTDTKRTMTNIINEVIRQYKFTSLPELNAILRLYHVEADRGHKESSMYKHNGLRYWVTDQSGNKMGVPIKASTIYTKPTMKKLDDRFRLGSYLRKPYKPYVKDKVASALLKSCSLIQLKAELSREHIAVLLRENADGRLYGITFVDLKNKVVFNGSDLGNYSAAAITATIESNAAGNQPLSSGMQNEPNQISIKVDIKSGTSLLEELLNPIDQAGPENLFERKKQKKRRKLNL